MDYFSNPYLTEAESKQADRISANQQQELQDKYLHSQLLEMLNRNNNVDSDEAQQQRLREIQQLKQANAELSQQNTEDLYAQANERIQKIIKSGNFDGNAILGLIINDPILSKLYPTDSQKIGLINQIKEAQAREANPANATEGSYIDTEEKGFLGSAWDSLKKGAANTAAAIYYDPQRIITLNELNNLPSEKLTQIKKKLDLQEELKDKIYETSKGLTSIDPAEKARALQEYNLYKKQLDGLQLSRDEQNTWDVYGDRFTDLMGKKNLLRAERDDFTGARVMTTQEAQEARESYARDRYFDRYKGGASYLNLEYAKEALKSKFTGSHLGSDLGAIAASALPFMLGGLPGLVGKAVSLGSDAVSRFADTMEHYFDKYGTIPNDDEIKALAGAIGSTLIDFYGSHIFVKGLSRAGFIKNLEDRLKDSFFSVRKLGNVDSRSMAYAVASKMQLEHLRPSTVNLKNELNKASKEIKQSLKGKPQTLSEKAWEGTKTALVEGNRALHHWANVGVQDLAKAGTKLAGENIGATLVDQWAKDEYDFNDVVDSAISGFVGGGMFHGVSAPASTVLRALSDKYAKHRRANLSRLDSNSEWKKSLKIINDSKNEEYKSDTIDEFSKRYTNLKEELVTQYNNAVTAAQKTFGDSITQDEKGNWVFNPEGKDYTSKQLKDGKSAVKDLNAKQAIVGQAVSVIDSRLQTLTDLQQNTVEADYEEATKENTKFSEERAEKAKIDFFKKSTNDAKKQKALQKDLAISEEQAKHILENKSPVIPEDENGKAFKDTLEKYGETNATIYEDLYGKDKVVKALEDNDSDAFKLALEDEVKSGTISKNRRDKLLKTFTPEIFEEAGRVDNDVDDNGQREDKEKGVKITVPFSQYNKYTKKDVRNSYFKGQHVPEGGLWNKLQTPSPTGDHLPARTSPDGKLYLSFRPGDSNPSPEGFTLEDAIADRLLTSDKDPFETAKEIKDTLAQYAANEVFDTEDREKAVQELQRELQQKVDNVLKDLTSEFKKQDTNNKKLQGKKLYKTEKEVNKEINKQRKPAQINPLVAEQVGSHWVISNVIDDMPEDTTKKLNDAVEDESIDAQQFLEQARKELLPQYSKATYGKEPLDKYVEKEFLKKIDDKAKELAKNGTKEKNKEFKKELLNRLLTLNSSISSAASDAKIFTEGVTHSYTAAQWAKEAEERFAKAEKEAKEQNKTNNKVAALAPEDVEEDVIIALNDVLSKFGFTVDSSIDEDALVKLLTDMNKKGIGVTHGDLILLDSYRKKLIGDKKYKNRESALKYLACLTSIFNLAKKKELVDLNDNSNHVLIPLGKKGYIWDKASDRKNAIDIINHFYKEGTSALEKTDVFSTIAVPEGLMSDTANTTMEDSKFRRKMNTYKAFYRRLIRNKRNKNQKDRLLKVFQVLHGYTETATGMAPITALGLIQKEIGDLTNEEEKFLANPADATIDSRILATLFVKIMKTETFRKFFGLSPSIKDTNVNNKLTQVRDDQVTLSNLISGNARSFVTIKDDDLTQGREDKSAYDNLVALDSYLGMEGALYETFWNLHNGESDELDAIRTRYRLNFTTTKQNTNFNSPRTQKYFTALIKRILKGKGTFTGLDTSKVNLDKLYDNLIKAIKTGGLQDILFGTVDRDIYDAVAEVQAKSRIKIGILDQNPYMGALAQAIAAQVMMSITDFSKKAETFKKAYRVFQLAETIKRINPEGYDSHEDIAINTADESQLDFFVSALRSAFHAYDPDTGNAIVTVDDLINFNKTIADKEYHLDDPQTTLGSLFTKEGDYRDIPDFENKPLSEGNDKVAKYLAAFINSFTDARGNKINNVYKGKKGGTKQKIISSNEYQHIENDLMTSSYFKDFSIGNPEDASPMASDNFINNVLELNPNYAGGSNLLNFVKKVKMLAKVASKFSFTAGNMADEIFFQRFAGETGTYNREVVTTMAAVALGMLTRMASGQSETWISAQESSGMFSKQAALKFANSRFISKNNLGEDLGNQILTALNIKSTSPEARANAKAELGAALAGRALNMLADSNVGGKEGIIKVKYFDCDTGDVTDYQPTTGRVISVIELTETGLRWSDEIIKINEARGTDKGNRHLISDLLNLNLDGRNYSTQKDYEEDQEKLKKRFDATHAEKIEPLLFEEPASGEFVEIWHDKEHDIVKVDLNPNYSIYLNRHEVIKKDGTMLSYSRLQENAYQKDTLYEINQSNVLHEFKFMKKPDGTYFTNYAEFLKHYENDSHLETYKSYLGIEDSEAFGVFTRADNTKNEVMFRQYVDFLNELSQIQPDSDGKVRLHFPVINTINNRVYFDSLGINPRELKFLRHLFYPKAKIWDSAENKLKEVGTDAIQANRTEQQQAVLMALIGANFGLDTDKAPMEELSKAGYSIINAIAEAQSNTGYTIDELSNIETISGVIKEANDILVRDKAVYTTTKKADTPIKLKITGESVLAVRELLKEIPDSSTPDAYTTVIDAIQRNLAINHFGLRLEIDGLTNGIGFHLTTSGWFGNNDSYSYALLAGVGVFPKDFKDMSIRDFVSAKMKAGALDSYENLGVNARAAAINNFTNMAVNAGRDILKDNLGLMRLLKQVYGVKSDDFKDIFNSILDRSTMKYVLMPASYGAGKQALVKYILTEISRKISERIFKMYVEPGESALAEINKFYAQIAALNGGRLTLIDADGNELDYRGQALSELEIKSYSMLIPMNDKLNDLFSSAIAEPIVNAADNLMSAAEEHTNALNKAADAICSTYNEMIATVLSSPEWKDVDITKLTKAQIESIAKRIQTAIHIGSDASSLNLLKDAVTNSVEILRIRVPSLLKKGKGIVLSAKNGLTKESIASALSPETNHTKDSDAINRCQAAIRDSLGAFVGIHDAIIANYNQITGKAGTSFNKEFLRSNLFAYRTLLELEGILNQCRSWIELHRDKTSVYKEGDLISSIDDALMAVDSVASNQISSRYKFLNRIINTGIPATINQYAMADITSYDVTPDIAKDLLTEIDGDMQNHLPNNESFREFELFVKQQANGIEYWRQIASIINPVNVFNLEQLETYLKDPKNGLGEARDIILDYLNAYRDYKKGATDNSFVLSMSEAMRGRSTSSTTGKINNLKYNNQFSPKTIKDQRARVKEITGITLQLATLAEDLGFVTNSSSMDRYFINRMFRLHNRISTNFGSRSALNNLVALTSRNNINIWELDELTKLLEATGLEDVDTQNMVETLDASKKSLVIDATDINLSDLLYEFKRQGIYGISESTALMNFIVPYINQLTTAVREKGFKQIVFRMDSAIDRILFSAVNKEILNATKDSAWDGVSIALAPSITDKASGIVDLDVSIEHQLIEKLGEGNVGFYTVLANNKNKNLKRANYKYNNIFTNDYINGNYIQRRNEEVPVLYKEGDPNGIQSHKVRSLNTKGNSYISTANALGVIDNNTFSNAKTVTPTYYHISTGDYSTSIINDDGNVRKYDGYSNSELDAEFETAMLNTVTIDEEDTRVIDANDNWESHIEEGTRLNIGIDSNGKINTANVYSTVIGIPALKEAYTKAQNVLRERQRRFDNGVYRSRDSILTPVEIPDVYVNGVKIHVRFNIVRDNMISLAKLKPVVVNTAKAINNNKVTYTIDPSASEEILSRFAYDSDQISQLYITHPEVRKFFNSITSNNATNPERVYIQIPDVLLNKQKYIMDSLSEEEPSNLAKLNTLALTRDGKPDIFLGQDSNRGKIYVNKDSITVNFSALTSTQDNNRGIINKLTDMFSALNKEKREQIRHYTDNNKSDEEMTAKEYALYKDIHCDDIDSISDNLNDIDSKNGVDNSHLFPILQRVKSANMLIRYRLNNQLGRQGSSVLHRVNGVKVGFISHGISKSGEGSNLEVFTHELVHIPLDFLKYDPTANKIALQLYSYVAKHLTLDHFDVGDKEDRRIFNYLFRHNTPDAHIEFLVYALTNARFKSALNNLMKESNLSNEFNAKLTSAFDRLLSKFDGSFEGKDINQIIDTIFTRTLDLAEHYYNKNPTIPPEAYKAQETMLEKANVKITKAISDFLSAIGFKSAGLILQMSATGFNPHRQDDSRFRQIQAAEIIPACANLLTELEDGKNELANELAQSFKSVSGDNWEYAKLRMAAKETVDKAREQGASALNAVVRDLTKNISTKTLNNMTDYFAHSDMQCLFTNHTTEEVLKLMKDKNTRYDRIKSLEKTLSKAANGNFFINASRGLSNKLIYGVNTSGIGYNNAYEIANMCGTQAETQESALEGTIDELVTLYTMHELDKQNPDVYKELANNFDTVKELAAIHNHLISQEKNRIYGDTHQKYHIPKGELHGGKSNNRYEIIPESQLQAYQWAGYRKIKDAKLDPLYSNLTKEKYILVGAKCLPDVPYVDAATVLTDIFNGRNKHGGYIGNKPIEEVGFEEFYKDEHNNTVVRYLNDQVKKLNKPNFQQMDPNSVDGMFTPSFGIGRSITGVDFVLNEKDINKRLGRNYKFTSILGDHYGSIIERFRAPQWNSKVAEVLDGIYKDKAGKSNFIWLNENEENPEKAELYKLLPYEIKNYFAENYPGKGVPIEEKNLTGVLGYRQLSALKVDKEYYDKLEHSTEEFIAHCLHSAPAAYAESLARYLTRIGKENLVIKGIAVSLGNITSNCVTLGIQGLTPKKVCEYQVEGLKLLREYNDCRNEIELLNAKDAIHGLSPTDKAKRKALLDVVHHSPLSTLARYGAIPTIAEDLTEQDRLIKDSISRYLPRELQTIFHNISGDQQSFVYKTLADLATFGDITAKYALFKHLTEEKGISKDEAVRQAVASFIDYSNPLPKPIQYLDSIGALPFTKFLLGNQTNIVNSLAKNPAGAMSWIMANSFMNVSDIYGSILGVDAITNRWHMPGFGLWYQSLASLPIVRATGAAASIL